MQFPGQYNEDAALAYLNRVASGHRDITQAQLNRRIADDLGRAVKPGRPIELADNEQVFHLKGSDLSAVNDKRELAKIAERGHAGKGGRYVVLNKDVVAHAHAISRPGGSRSEIGRMYDRVQGGFKLVATQPNPAFHLRNFIGDVQNAYLGQSAFALPGNLARSQKALRALGRQEVAQRTLGKAARPVRGTVKVGNKRMTYEELANEAAHVGAIRSGFTARELHDLIQAEQQGTRKVTRTAAGRAAGRWARRSSGWCRDARTCRASRRTSLLASAAWGRRRRHGRRRSTTSTTRTCRSSSASTPAGRCRSTRSPRATCRCRPDAARQAGQVRQLREGPRGGRQGGGDAARLREGPARVPAAPGVGIPVSWKGHKFTCERRGDCRSPTSTSSRRRRRPDQAGRRVHAARRVDGQRRSSRTRSSCGRTTLRSSATRSAANAPLVAAPVVRRRSRREWKKRFHVAKIVDKRTGKMVWGGTRRPTTSRRPSTPGSEPRCVLTSGTGRQGQGTAQKAIGLTGVRPTPYDPVTTEINNLYRRHDEIRRSSARWAAGRPRQGRIPGEREAEP
jgi:hypothetical protein